MKNLLTLALAVIISLTVFLIGTGYTWFIPVTKDSNTISVYEEKNSTQTGLQEFVNSVVNGNAESIVGLYVSKKIAFTVVQQPNQNPAFVSDQSNTLTQFGMAEKYKTIGLLAHNYLAGGEFVNLNINQYITIIYGDGAVKHFKIIHLDTYQALSPTNPYSDFIDLSDPERQIINSTQLFEKIYSHGNQLILQTCISNEYDDSWGRLFITAKPVSQQEYLSVTSFQNFFDSPVRLPANIN